jgi:hydroxyquinol 1,2-dioxygenase
MLHPATALHGVAQWRRHEAGLAPDGTRMTTPFSTLEFDFVLNRSA